jgi:inorganic pyrophosphatase
LIRNDRLIAVATPAKLLGNIEKLKELNIRILNEIKAFFHQYNKTVNRKFRTLGQCRPKSALKLIKAGQKRLSQFA